MEFSLPIRYGGRPRIPVAVAPSSATYGFCLGLGPRVIVKSIKIATNGRLGSEYAVGVPT
jgi:hypothetical protein